jgi:tRNA(adenine34) deaminase
MESDILWMQRALEEADVAASRGEVPVGCVITDAAGRELARGHNVRESEGDPTAHAEMVAVRAAAAQVGGWRLEGATAYVTLEPCAMCAGALVLARIKRLVFGSVDPKAGAVTTLFGIGVGPHLNHRFEITQGVCAEECAARLQTFFARLRSSPR